MTLYHATTREKFFFFFSGMIISAPFPILANSMVDYFLQSNFPTFTASVISVAIIAPFIEEFAKAYPLFYRHGETKQSLLTFGFLAGLGFGITEFLLYVFALQTPVAIRLPALLFHATNTVIVAHGINQHKAGRFYLLAVGLHFMNNFLAVYGFSWYIGGLAAILISYLLAYFIFRQTADQPTTSVSV